MTFEIDYCLFCVSNLSSFCDKKNVSFDWLLTGEGEPERKKDVVSEAGVIYNSLIESIQNRRR